MVYKLLEVDKGVAGVKVFTAEREDEQSSCAARAAVASALMRSSDPRTPHLADFVSCGRCGVDTSLTTCTANLVTHTDKRSLKKNHTNGQSSSYCLRPSHHRDSGGHTVGTVLCKS